MTYEEMAADAGYRGEEAAQVAAALEARERAEAEREWAAEQEAFAQAEIEEERMSDVEEHPITLAEIEEWCARPWTVQGDPAGGRWREYVDWLIAKLEAAERRLVAARPLIEYIEYFGAYDDWEKRAAEWLGDSAQEEQRE